MTEVTQDMRRGFAQLRKIEDGFLSGSLDPEDARQPLQLIIERKFGEPTTTKIAAALSDPYTVSVNYGRKLKTAIKAGKYDWTNDLYDGQQFSDWQTPDGNPLEVPKRGTVEKEQLLFHVGAFFGDEKLHSTEEILAALERLELKPETVHETLAFGEQHPDVQREFPVIGLGSVWVGPHGARGVAGLWSFAAERRLGLNWDGDQWGPSCRILVSRA